MKLCTEELLSQRGKESDATITTQVGGGQERCVGCTGDGTARQIRTPAARPRPQLRHGPRVSTPHRGAYIAGRMLHADAALPVTSRGTHRRGPPRRAAASCSDSIWASTLTLTLTETLTPTRLHCGKAQHSPHHRLSPPSPPAPAAAPARARARACACSASSYAQPLAHTTALHSTAQLRHGARDSNHQAQPPAPAHI